MRITESQLRRIIHEEARKILKEMPYAGSIGSVTGQDPDDSPRWMTGPSSEDIVSGRKAAQALAGSQGFKKLATRLYGNFPVPVWTAHFAGSFGKLDRRGFSGRSRVVDLDAGMEIMKQAGFSESALAAVDTQKDLVVLYASEVKGKLGTMATPWMIFHAIFDSEVPGSMDLEGYEELLYMWEDKQYDLTWVEGQPKLKREFWDTMHNVLTMRSARERALASIDDTPNEMIVQQLITARGLQYNEKRFGALTPSDQEFFSRSKELVKAVADSFTRAAAGKLIMISIDPG